MDTQNLTNNPDESHPTNPVETEDSGCSSLTNENDSNVVAEQQITCPKMLEDSTLDAIPEYAEYILRNCDKSRSTESEILMAIIYCIALENGYAPITELDNNQYEGSWGFTYHANNLNKLKKIPIDFKELYDGFHKYTMFVLNVSEKHCILCCIKSGDCIFVTLTPESVPGRSICLSLPRFVLSLKNQPYNLRFRHMKELTQLLRDNIFIPIRNERLKEQNLPFPGLDGLPTLVLTNIFKYLSVKDLHVLAQTGWELRIETISYYVLKCKPIKIPFTKN